MIYRSTKQQIEEYYAISAINQSALKELIWGGVEAFRDKYLLLVSQSDLYYEEKAHFIIGSAVDCRITEGEEEFNNRYHISKLIKKPGEKAMSVIKKVFDTVVPIEEAQDHDIGTLDIYQSYILAACIEHDYNNRWGADAKFNGICREDGGYTTVKDKEPIFKGGGYWEDLKLATGKIILSDIEANTTINICNSFINHHHTSNLFRDGDNIDIVYQFPILFTIDGVECKGLIDIVIVNHTARRIIPCDIKTIGDYVSNFRRSIKSRRYDIQGSFYGYGLSKTVNLASLSSLIGKDVYEYKMANFAFIVESTIKQGIPLVFVLSPSLIEQGRNGDPTAEGSLRFGWQHGIDQYKLWSSHDFSVENRVAESNGVVFVDADYEYTNL